MIISIPGPIFDVRHETFETDCGKCIKSFFQIKILTFIYIYDQIVVAKSVRIIYSKDLKSFKIVSQSIRFAIFA